MRFSPQSEAEVQKSASKFGPWPNGVYDFEVAESADDTSKNGNDMISLTLYIFNSDGDRRTVFDYLLDSIPHKLRHAAYACGLSSQYEDGNLIGADFYGKTGRVKIGIQPEKDGYQAKNVVRDYIVERGASETTSTPRRQPAPAGNIDDDEIPF